jgi:hypothetical protein
MHSWNSCSMRDNWLALERVSTAATFIKQMIVPERRKKMRQNLRKILIVAAVATATGAFGCVSAANAAHWHHGGGYWHGGGGWGGFGLGFGTGLALGAAPYYGGYYV